ncbi:MAG: quinoprotein relay system zinc metallohydrolase 2 [Proteobacteria bacterium]|nr:quinoprotein relay system zinc metallohydrolase 2 [Pseudomonadota bacterium]
MKAINKYFLITLLLALSCKTAASDATDDFNLVNVDEGIYAHIGRHLSIEDEQRDDIANIGFIIGDNCVAVVDTGGSIAVGKKLLKAIRSITEKPVCYVINTHIHYDHLLGNKVFVSKNTTFVGHKELAAAVEHNRQFFLDQFKSELGDNPDPSAIIAPTKLVADKEELDLGDRTLTLISYPISHSHNDLVVLDNKTKTLWSGDLIFRERVPSLTGSLKGWVKVMGELQKLEVNKVIPGHGSIADSIPEAIKQQQAYLKLLLDETRKAVAEGLFVNDAMQTIDKDNRLNWLLHEYQHPTNVSRAFSELEWE